MSIDLPSTTETWHLVTGSALRQARLDAGISQAELAKRYGCTPGWIGQLEALGKIAHRFCEYDYNRLISSINENR
ncbi:MAG: helix-turn-helix transcriptional regulator [Sedimentisphaerales bacterium]|nr:helix-turn-helix transcriptional regulator [Sedimentisphaerales bacterium]